MNLENLLTGIDTLAQEKGVEREAIEDAVTSAFAAATRRELGLDNADIRSQIDRDGGKIISFRRWQVVSDDDSEAMQNPDWEFDADLHLRAADARDKGLKLGDVYEERLPDSSKFGRIYAQAFKQVMMQKTRDAERERVMERYQGREGELLSGSVKKVTRDNIIVGLVDDAEALLPRDKLVGREIFRVGDRVLAILEGLNLEGRGPELLVSRSSPQMLVELFRREVPEVEEQIITIHNAVRDPGQRAKIIVKTNDGRIDPVGACIGIRGARVQAVTNDLNGERIDIIHWDDDPSKLLMEALSPARVESIVIDEDAGSVDVGIAEDNLPQAIGRGGQNVRLASQLTGWRINIMTAADAEQKHQQDMDQFTDAFAERLGVDTDLARVLAEEGFSKIEQIAMAPLDDLAVIEGFDEDIAAQLRERAGQALQLMRLSNQADVRPPSADLLQLPGISPELARQLAENGICTRSELADQSVPEIADLMPGVDEQLVADLIMQARATPGSA